MRGRTGWATELYEVRENQFVLVFVQRPADMCVCVWQGDREGISYTGDAFTRVGQPLQNSLAPIFLSYFPQPIRM